MIYDLNNLQNDWSEAEDNNRFVKPWHQSASLSPSKKGYWNFVSEEARSQLIASIAVISLFALGAGCTQSSGTPESIPDGAITTNQQGIDGGYFYSFWSAGGGTVYMTLGTDGNYATRWIACNNFTAGKGWKVGGRKNVHYAGSFDGGSNGSLAVYGWTLDPLVEYYIVENHGDWTPPGGSAIGSIVSNGGTYNIYKTRRTNQPSIIGTATFDQFWSVRTSGRDSGTVTTGNHFDAWARLGMTLGTSFDYMIVATEGYGSTGSSNITVSD